VRILLVNPAQPASLHTFTEAADIVGVPAFIPNLALPTLASLAPPDFEVKLVDEMVEPIDFTTRWDLIGSPATSRKSSGCSRSPMSSGDAISWSPSGALRQPFCLDCAPSCGHLVRGRGRGDLAAFHARLADGPLAV
jgi:hypothetical protein